MDSREDASGLGLVLKPAVAKLRAFCFALLAQLECMNLAICAHIHNIIQLNAGHFLFDYKERRRERQLSVHLEKECARRGGSAGASGWEHSRRNQ